MQAKRRLLFLVSRLLVFCVAVAIASPAQVFTTLVNFDGNNGSFPFSPLVQATDGSLYGTTIGNYQYKGTLFKITLGGTLTTLYTFCSQPNCIDGSGPAAGLVPALDGNFYGITQVGGASNEGTIFKITPSGTLTTLYSFCSQPNCADGSAPSALVQGNDGNFYGTTLGGYPYYGTVFKVTPTGNLATLHSFCSQPNCADGYAPTGLVQATDGSFYGTTAGGLSGGGLSGGSVFKISPGGTLTTLYRFGGNDGFRPNTLVQATDGNFYGTTFDGGTSTNCNGGFFGSCGTAFNLSVGLAPPLPVLRVFASGNGTVTSTDGFINCPVTCSHSYPSNTQVTLNAAPAAGWIFSGWSGTCSGTGACTVTMTQSLSAGATFSEPLQLVTVSPCRAVDTRPAYGGNGPIQGGTQQDFPISGAGNCATLPNAAVYSTNVTVVPGPTLGYLTIWPAGQPQPLVSTLNSPDGRVKANAAIVPAGAGGNISVYVTDTTNVIVDVNGYFAPVSGSTLAFYPLTPCRVADTRYSTYPQGLGPPSLTGGQPRVFPILNATTTCNIPTSGVAAYSLNFTVVPHGTLGYLTVWPTGETQPTVSTLNDVLGRVIANAAIVVAGGSGEISAYATDNTDLIIDIDGYFAPAGQGGLSLYAVAPCRVIDTRHVGSGQPFTGTLTPPVDVEHSQCGPPATAQAYVFNATVIPPGSLGYLTLWPDGALKPLVSTLNAADGSITNNMAIVPTTNGKIDAYAGNGLTQLILDISNFFAP